MNHKSISFVQMNLDDMGVKTDGKLHPPAPPEEQDSESPSTPQSKDASKNNAIKPERHVEKEENSPADGKPADAKPDHAENTDAKAGSMGDAPGGVNEVADYDEASKEAAEKYGRQLMSQIHMSKLEHQENERELLDELIEAILILARRFDALAAKDDPATCHPGMPGHRGMGMAGAFNAGMRSSMAGSMAAHPGMFIQHKPHPPVPNHPQQSVKPKEKQPAKEPAPTTRQFGVVHVHGSVKLLHNRQEIIRDIGYKANDFAEREVVKGLPEKKDDNEEEDE